MPGHESISRAIGDGGARRGLAAVTRLRLLVGVALVTLCLGGIKAATVLVPVADDVARLIPAARSIGQSTKVALVVARPYSRDLFGYTVATRHAFLAKTAEGAELVIDARGRVVSGTWTDTFTGQRITDVSEASVDHVVSLKWAWERGAKHWPDELLRKFGTDVENLAVTTRAGNRAKGMAGPGDWSPDGDVAAGLLRARQDYIIAKYGLAP